ncbi:MAG: hypothetical protein WC405_21540, partial [Syntrophales bacterium]
MTVSINNRWLLVAVVVVMLAIGVMWFYFPEFEDNGIVAADTKSFEASPLPMPEFVGRAACAGCHAEQDRRWQGSHHDLAMQEANENTVLGDFRDAEFNKDGVVSRFFRKEGRYLVSTDGPDGKLADFQIKYSFGITPLQQYLIELPGGRLQALSISWDSRPKEQGGQRWFHLYAN